jgi:hypothetical protein
VSTQQHLEASLTKLYEAKLDRVKLGVVKLSVVVLGVVRLASDWPLPLLRPIKPPMIGTILPQA